MKNYSCNGSPSTIYYPHCTEWITGSRGRGWNQHYLIFFDLLSYSKSALLCSMSKSDIPNYQIHKYTNTQIQLMTKCQKYPTYAIFLNSWSFKGVKNDIPKCSIHKYRNTDKQTFARSTKVDWSSYFHILGFQVLLIASLTWHVLLGSGTPVTIGLLPLLALHQMCQECLFAGVCNMNYKSSRRGITKRTQYGWFSPVSKYARRESFNSLNS